MAGGRGLGHIQSGEKRNTLYWHNYILRRGHSLTHKIQIGQAHLQKQGQSPTDASSVLTLLQQASVEEPIDIQVIEIFGEVFHLLMKKKIRQLDLFVSKSKNTAKKQSDNSTHTRAF